MNLSINEILGRTFLTSFATALSLVGLLVFGVGTIFDFAIAMLIGIISGTYSTWFIAGPMTIWLEERAERSARRGPAPRPGRRRRARRRQVARRACRSRRPRRPRAAGPLRVHPVVCARCRGGSQVARAGPFTYGVGAST